MIISTLYGHLTATNKKHIKAILDLDLTEAKVNRINYIFRKENEVYTVFILEKDNSIEIGEKIRKSKATFKIV